MNRKGSLRKQSPTPPHTRYPEICLEYRSVGITSVQDGSEADNPGHKALPKHMHALTIHTSLTRPNSLCNMLGSAQAWTHGHYVPSPQPTMTKFLPPRKLSRVNRTARRLKGEALTVGGRCGVRVREEGIFPWPQHTHVNTSQLGGQRFSYPCHKTGYPV
jgi:hypothetical protein